MEQKVIAVATETVVKLFGSYDVNARLIEKTLNVHLMNRPDEALGDAVVVSGESAEAVSKAAEVIRYLRDMASGCEELTEQQTQYVLDMVRDGRSEELAELGGDCICVTTRGKPIRAKTVGQKQYVEAIRKNTVVFGVGPAGTGKTFLAVAMAVKALREKSVNRIILTRPAIEAGEKLGFLPGDLQSKIDPYLRPLYDALNEMMGAEDYQKHIEKTTIEIAPLAYMRGRTLDDSFIILDEAQNATPEQMKMFLTRLGANSKAVVTGDLTQTDLPSGQKSGLAEAVKILDHIEDIHIHVFSDKDVVRHKLVQRIILAYDKYERAKAVREEERREASRNGEKKFVSAHRNDSERKNKERD
jgi:phosphate starvation-inducible PhoH-like protein